jgi:integrase
MLLYAQPASRLVRLTTDDILQDNDGHVLIRLGDPPTPVPEPFADLLLRAQAETIASSPDPTWLFPSRAGQPLHSRTLADHVRNLGIPGASGRAAALRQLTLQAPAPVVAEALGFHDKTTLPHRSPSRQHLEPLCPQRL